MGLKGLGMYIFSGVCSVFLLLYRMGPCWLSFPVFELELECMGIGHASACVANTVSLLVPWTDYQGEWGSLRRQSRPQYACIPRGKQPCLRKSLNIHNAEKNYSYRKHLQAEADSLRRLTVLRYPFRADWIRGEYIFVVSEKDFWWFRFTIHLGIFTVFLDFGLDCIVTSHTSTVYSTEC